MQLCFFLSLLIGVIPLYAMEQQWPIKPRYITQYRTIHENNCTIICEITSGAQGVAVRETIAFGPHNNIKLRRMTYLSYARAIARYGEIKRPASK